MTQMHVEYLGNLITHSVLCTENGAEIFTEAPKDHPGKGELFSPTDLLALSLASCVLTILGIQAQKLNLDIKGTKAKVTKEMSTSLPRRIKKVRVEVSSPHTFSKEITETLEQAAIRCPVHHSLHPEISQEFDFQWGLE